MHVKKLLRRRGELVSFEPRKIIESPADPSDQVLGLQPVEGDVHCGPGADIDKIARGPHVRATAAPHPAQNTEADAIRSIRYS
jgi:hypothetical protein